MKVNFNYSVFELPKQTISHFRHFVKDAKINLSMWNYLKYLRIIIICKEKDVRHDLPDLKSFYTII